MNEGRKNDSDKPGLDMLSSKALIEIAKVMDHGKRKYAKHNWRSGIVFSRLIAAVLRHILAWNDGETLDSETGISHLAHASCGLMFLLEFEQTRPDLDDRYISTSIGNSIQKTDTIAEQKDELSREDIRKIKQIADEKRMQLMADAVKAQSELGTGLLNTYIYSDTVSSEEMNKMADENLKKLNTCFCGDPNCHGSGAV